MTTTWKIVTGVLIVGGLAGGYLLYKKFKKAKERKIIDTPPVQEQNTLSAEDYAKALKLAQDKARADAEKTATKLRLDEVAKAKLIAIQVANATPAIKASTPTQVSDVGRGNLMNQGAN